MRCQPVLASAFETSDSTVTQTEQVVPRSLEAHLLRSAMSRKRVKFGPVGIKTTRALVELSAVL